MIRYNSLSTISEDYSTYNATDIVLILAGLGIGGFLGAKHPKIMTTVYGCAIGASLGVLISRLARYL